MVECRVCKESFKRITEAHLKKHKLSYKQYVECFPNADLISQESRLAYSNATKNYFQEHKEEVRERISNRTLSSEGLLQRSENMKKRWRENKAQFITAERNQKVAEAKKEWWNKKSDSERSEFVREKVVSKAREKLGEEAYRAQLREKGIKGHQVLMYKGSNKLLNNFEQEMIDTIKSKGFECIAQYEVDKWYYDCYIPEKNLLVEFDGDYWHPKTFEECTNSRLKRRWEIDRKKEEFAKHKGYSIVRIRQSEKFKIFNFLN